MGGTGMVAGVGMLWGKGNTWAESCKLVGGGE